MNKIITIWSFFSIFVLFASVIIFYSIGSKANFFIVLNIINFIFYMTFISFRKIIERHYNYIIYISSDVEPTYTFKNEKYIGNSFILIIFLFITYVLYLIIFDVTNYFHLIREDGVVEYMSALFWICSAVFIIICFLKNIKQINKYSKIIYLLLFLFFFVCAGEEISWGQRLLGLETPDSLSMINVQNEINLHNIGSISVFSNLFFLITVVFFLAIPYFYKNNSNFNKIMCYLRFPVPNRYSVYIYIFSFFVWVIVGIRFGTLGFSPLSWFPEQYYTQMDDELFELMAAYSFFCFSALELMKNINPLSNFTEQSQVFWPSKRY
jgi:hypothetical protein